MATTVANWSSISNETSMFKYNGGFSISFVLISTAIFVFGVLGNTAVISSILKTRTLRASPTFIVLLSMAVSDLLRVLFIGLHLNIQLVYSSWIAGQLWCQLFLFIVFTVASSGNSHVALIAVCRYVILVHPFFTKRVITVKTVVLTCGGIWVTSILLNIPMAMSTGIVATPIYETKSMTCQPTSRVVYLMRFVLCYLLPLSLIAGFHVAKVVRLSKTSIVVESMKNDQQIKKQVSNVSVILIILTFVLLWLPKAITWFLAGAVDLNINGGILLTISTCMSYANSALNPVIYFFPVKSLRKSLCCLTEASPESTSTDVNRDYIYLSTSKNGPTTYFNS